jgi:hypothetical protein
LMMPSMLLCSWNQRIESSLNNSEQIPKTIIVETRVIRFFLVQYTNTEKYTKLPQTIPNYHKLYQITTNYTKLPQTKPNYHKLYQITTNYTKLPQSIPNYHKLYQITTRNWSLRCQELTDTVSKF